MPSKLEQMQLQFRQKLQQEKQGKQAGQSLLPRPTGVNGTTRTTTSATSIRQTSVVKTITQSENNGQLKSGSANGSSNGKAPLLSCAQTTQKPKPVAKSSTVRQNVVTQSRVMTSNARGPVTTMMTTAQLQTLRTNMKQKNCDELDATKSVKAPPPKPVVQKVPLNSRTETKSVSSVVKKVPEKPKEVKVVKKTTQTTLSSSNQVTASRSNAVPSSTKPAAPKPSIKSIAKKPPPAAYKKSAPSKPVPNTQKPLDPNLERCDICGRGFAKDRIDKHRSVCEKASKKKAKVFDATKMRTKGTEAEKFVRLGYHKKDVPVKKSNWRAKHEDFINTVRQAKILKDHLAAGGKLSDLPPPPPSENPDYVPCPHCGRKFSEAAAERHIPKCKNIISNKKPVRK